MATEEESAETFLESLKSYVMVPVSTQRFPITHCTDVGCPIDNYVFAEKQALQRLMIANKEYMYNIRMLQLGTLQQLASKQSDSSNNEVTAKDVIVIDDAHENNYNYKDDSQEEKMNDVSGKETEKMLDIREEINKDKNVADMLDGFLNSQTSRMKAFMFASKAIMLAEQNITDGQEHLKLIERENDFVYKFVSLQLEELESLEQSLSQYICWLTFEDERVTKESYEGRAKEVHTKLSTLDPYLHTHFLIKQYLPLEKAALRHLLNAVITSTYEDFGLQSLEVVNENQVYASATEKGKSEVGGAKYSNKPVPFVVKQEETDSNEDNNEQITLRTTEQINHPTITQECEEEIASKRRRIDY